MVFKLQNTQLLITDLLAVAIFINVCVERIMNWPEAIAFVCALSLSTAFRIISVKEKTVTTDYSAKIVAIEDDIKNLRSALALKRQ
jgi:hypothetical protein